jgi:hypothetical protein
VRRAFVGLIVAGCRFHPGAGVDGAPGDDGSIDVAFEGIAPCVSYSSQLDTCMVGPGMGGGGALVLTGNNTYDTDTNTLHDNLGNDTNPPHVVVAGMAGPIDVLFVDGFTLAPAATLRVDGNNAFGIASTGLVQIDGLLDATDKGAGARGDPDCGTAVGTKGQNSTSGAGGGGGGAFQGAGGVGGTGNKDGTNTTGGLAGVAAPRPLGPAGGCDGGPGGDGDASGGNGGDGGGAILIASATAISIGATGVINVGGGGGAAGGNTDDGGGGGGSGGMILLESISVAVAGVLAANGGGGGEGSNGKGGGTGQASTTPAAAGSGADGNGGNGGDGGVRGAPDGVPATDLANGGGGGGGGGVGYIAIACPAPAIIGTISPAFAAWP